MNANGHGAGRRAQLVGTGLIGGSIAAALRAAGWHVPGRDAVEAHAARALELGVIDEVGVDPDAEVTFVAVPPGELVAEIERALDTSRGIVTDTGSVKMTVTSSIDHPRFVGGHPMAGSEQDGVDGSDPSIFDGAVWVLTPGPSTDDDALHTLQAIVAAMGADVVTMTAPRHDSLVAVVSHVPHLMAATMMALADDRSLGQVGECVQQATELGQTGFQRLVLEAERAHDLGRRAPGGRSPPGRPPSRARPPPPPRPKA